MSPTTHSELRGASARSPGSRSSRHFGNAATGNAEARRGLDDGEFATMINVDWFNRRCFHGEITDDATYTTLVEAEADYYRQTTTAAEAVTQ